MSFEPDTNPPSYEDVAARGITGDRPHIDTFPNQFPGAMYLHEITVGEFTSMCPKTGMPDFGVVRIRYIADKSCLELKSLKFYFYSYRNVGIFYENLVNVILTDLVRAARPAFMEVVLTMTPRGGVSSRLARRHTDSQITETIATDLCEALESA